jgi:hypothetical protein
MLRYLNITFGFLAIVMFFSCASPSRPMGGPKDEAPPIPILASPENFSTYFQAKTIVVRFDENIQLKNLNQQLIISPPMAKPEIRANNRTLTIRLQDTLRQNSTYVMSFGDAVTDLNEGNVLSNFQYVFSTGGQIDSLTVVGEVLDAYTLQPMKDIGITLLSNLDDLGLKTERPVYIAKSDKEGHFQFNFLHEGCYYLAAINDKNNDWTYDSLQEEVAFLLNCVSPKYLEKPMFPGDSCSREDSLQILDSIKHFYQTGYQLLLFKQELPQGVSKSDFLSNAVIQVEFRNRTEQAEFRMLQPEIEPENYHVRWDKNKQKAEIFLTELGIRNFLLYVEDGNFSDTLKLLNTKYQDKVPPLKITLASGNELPYFDTLKLLFSAPIREIEEVEKSFWLYSGTDTIPIPLTDYSFNPSRTQLVFDVSLKQRTDYKLMIPDSLFFDYFDQTNDTLNLKFRTNTPENYARLAVKLLNKPADSCILQVLSEKLELVEQQVMHTDSASFTTLKPGKYRLRLIVDQNLNGRWDAGNLRERRLPEPVFILPKTLSLEADWDYEEEWEL